MNDMVDMSRFVEAKSDQLNADDLIGITKTITVTRVTGSDGDQPVAIFFQGDNGKPFKPCKTMRRVLMAIWGRYANDYVGKSMTLYRDDRVTFGGLETGGIRISHMSHMEKETLVVVMKTKGKKAGIKIQPLKAEQRQRSEQGSSGAELTLEQAKADLSAAPDLDALKTVWSRRIMAPLREQLAEHLDKCKRDLSAGFDEGPADSQRGEANTFSPDDLIGFINQKVRRTDLDSFLRSHTDTLASFSEEDAQRVRDAAYARADQLQAE